MLSSKCLLHKLLTSLELRNSFLKLLKFLVIGSFSVQRHNFQIDLAVVLLVQSVSVLSLYSHGQSLL